MKDNQTIFQNELEAITGMIFKGDITPVVFDLLKDSPNLDKLYTSLTNEVIESKDDNKDVLEVEAAPSFENWFSSFRRV